MDPYRQQHLAHMFLGTLFPLFFLFGIVLLALYVIPLWKIAQKAGLAGPIALLAIIPVVGKLIALYVIAFSNWQVIPAAGQYGTLSPGYPPAYPPSYPPAPPSPPAQL